MISSLVIYPLAALFAGACIVFAMRSEIDKAKDKKTSWWYNNLFFEITAITFLVIGILLGMLIP